MTDEEALPVFPTDDVTLDAVEHALGGAYVVDLDGTHRLVGADYTLTALLDFLAGTMGEDPDAVVVDPGHDVPEDAPLADQIAGARVVIDSRIHYSEHDLIRALVGEVRRLRAAYAGVVPVPVPVVAPFGVSLSADGVEAVWSAFVEPAQTNGLAPQSVELRSLMAILRAVHKGLRDYEEEG